MDTKTLLPKIYISLPMSGITNNNIELELQAFAKARSMGYWVYTPSRIATVVNKKIKNPEYKHFLGFDIWSLSQCDAMLLCPGWENSKGCKIEVNFALLNSIPIFDFRTGKLYDFDADALKIEMKNIENYERLLKWFTVICISVFILTSIIYFFNNHF